MWKFLLIVFLALMSVGASPSVEQQIQALDVQIEELEEKKRGFEGRALYHEHRAEFTQFEQQMVLETRRNLQLAQENREKAAAVQVEIDRLTLQKKQLENSLKKKWLSVVRNM